jgi:hypothetical protein
MFAHNQMTISNFGILATTSQHEQRRRSGADEPRLEEDEAYRAAYGSEFMGFGDDDIHSPGFAGLPVEVREYVLRRMWEVLGGQDQTEKFAHLSPTDRAAVLETLPDLPEYWRAKDAG